MASEREPREQKPEFSKAISDLGELTKQYRDEKAKAFLNSGWEIPLDKNVDAFPEVQAIFNEYFQKIDEVYQRLRNYHKQ